MNYIQLVTDVENGNENPLRAYLKLYEFKKQIDKAIEYIKDYAVLEASKHEKGSVIDGRTITYCKGRAMWSFKNIDEWNHKKQELMELEETLKQAYEAKNNGFSLLDIKTGELKQVPEVTYSSDYITIK